MRPPAVSVLDRRPDDEGAPPIVDTALTDPNDEPGPLSRRVLRPRTLISFGIAAALILFILRRFDLDPQLIWSRIRQANPTVYGLAFVVWYSSFFLRAIRWRRMLARAGVDRASGFPVPGVGGTVEILLLSWFVNCVVPAKLGDFYRSYLLKQETNASFSTGLGTIAAERLIDLSVLFASMLGVGLILFRGDLPGAAAQGATFGAALLGLAAVGLAVMWWSRHALQRRLPHRLREQYGRLHEAVFGSLRRPELFIAISVLLWFGEGARFWLVARSLGADLAPATALFIALLGALLTAVPLTPAGLGVVELVIGALMTEVLRIDRTLVASILILDRVIAYWSLIAIGLALYLRRLGRERRTET